MNYDFEPLKGRSNAKISFDYEHKFVRKSEKKANKKRLHRQVKKQLDFPNFNFENIKTPVVLKTEEFSFEMEFINGKNFIQFAEESNISDINTQIDNILNYLNHIKFKKLKPRISFSESVQMKLNKLDTSNKYPEIYKFIEESNFGEKLNLESTYCHGDLSLSNIIFKENELFFIDFLDPFFDSYYLDIVKLRQDVLHHWIFKINNYSSIKCEIITKKINDAISFEFQKEIESVEFQILEIMNFLRIEPYTKEDTEKQYLIGTINKIFNNIRV
jgi:thiamine kinase-like enzyme